MRDALRNREKELRVEQNRHVFGDEKLDKISVESYDNAVCTPSHNTSK
jgi:hypothetical protein